MNPALRRRPPTLTSLVVTLMLAAGLWPHGAHAQESALAALRTSAATHAPAANLALGHALRRAGHFAEAVRTLQSAARGSTRAEALWEIARVRFDEGNFRASETACNALPAGLLKHVCMGRAYLVWHRVALAEREIAAAHTLDANHGELHLLIADAQRQANQVEPAEQAYRAATSAMPGRAEPLIGLGLLHETAQRFDDALGDYRHAVEIDAADPMANLALGRFLLKRRHDHTAALPYLRRANDDRPGWSEALVVLGDAHLAAGSIADALTAYGQAAQILPTEPGAQSGLGRARLANNQIAEAEAPLRAAIAQVPNDVDAHIALADVLGRTQRGDESIEAWNRAIDLVPGDSGPRMRAALQAHAMAQNSLARAYIDRILSDDAQNAPALLLRADIAFDENDRANARTLYQSALSGHGEIDRAHAQARIAEIDAPQQHQRRR